MDKYKINLLSNLYYDIQKKSFWDEFNELLHENNLKYQKLDIYQKIDISSKTFITSINTDKKINSLNELFNNIFIFPDINLKLNSFEVFLLLIKRIHLIETLNINLSKNPLTFEYLQDPVNYNSSETGKNYSINIKKTNKKKIIAESLFRTFKRNDRLPEYLSGLLCNVNNIKNLMGDEWGYRLYVDKSLLKKNIIYKNTNINNKTQYNYMEFDKKDIDKWINLFDNKDEGQMFYNLLKQLNDLDYVEIYCVELTGDFLDENGYVYGLFGTNYRFHASTDKTKEIVYMKDIDSPINEINIKNWSLFEKSNKNITYFYLPWYKPPTHAIIQYPFTIIAFFWGLKPQNITLHYTFDDILEYFRNYNNVDEKNYLDRTLGSELKIKGLYGSDEIILTDLIFSGFKQKDTFPFADELNIILLFYIITYTFYDNNEFKNILNTAFIDLKTKNTENKLEGWNLNDLSDFLFGNANNKFCCILPLYNNIKNKYITLLYYLAYTKTTYEMIESNDNCELNFRETFYQKISYYMCCYDNKLDNKITIEELNDAVFNLTFSNQFGWSPMDNKKEVVLLKNDDYLYNRYYFRKEYINDKILWDFIYNVIDKTRALIKGNKIIETMYSIYFDKEKKGIINTIWSRGEKDFNKCVFNKQVNLLGGYYNGDNNFNCINGDYKVLIKNMSIKYNYYEDRFKPLLNDTNKIIDNNFVLHNDDIKIINDKMECEQNNTLNNDELLKKYLKYKNKYIINKK